MRKISILILLATLLIYLFSLSSCYYDNLERLNPTSVCDTSGSATYSGTVKSIMDNNCTSCHSGASPSGNISLDTYTAVKNVGITGKLYNSITWASGTSPMPKGSNSKIDDCSIIKIKKWIDTNYLP